MKTALIICTLLCAASAAQAEEEKQTKELGEEVMPKEEEELVAVDPVPVAEDDEALFQEASAPEARFNYCPPGWFKRDSECFQFNTIRISWFDAEEFCKSQGAHLASAKNSQQYSFLQLMSQGMGLSYPWLGGFYLQGRWLWANFDSFSYTNWYHQSNPSSYSCIFLRHNLGWQNDGCGTARSFICSRNLKGC